MNRIWRGKLGRAIALAAMAVPASAAQRELPAVTTIAVTPAGAETVVTIGSSGQLPAPTVGFVDGPPRIFLDFAGVNERAPAVTRSTDPRVMRVRVAVHSSTPLVTRVVVDLRSPQPARVEQDAASVRLVIGGAAATAPPPPSEPPSLIPPLRPVPPLPEPAPSTPARSTEPPRLPPMPAAPADSPRPAAAAPADAPKPGTGAPAPVPYKRPTPLPPAKDAEKYRGTAGQTIERLVLQRPLLESLNTFAPLPADRIQLAINEFERIREDLGMLSPPESVRPQHDLLQQAARLGAMAMRLRGEALQTNDPALLKNAASAAAGAILTLDRACDEVGWARQ